jgi:hypothetical protein
MLFNLWCIELRELRLIDFVSDDLDITTTLVCSASVFDAINNSNRNQSHEIREFTCN